MTVVVYFNPLKCYVISYSYTALTLTLSHSCRRGTRERGPDGAAQRPARRARYSANASLYGVLVFKGTYAILMCPQAVSTV
jgi:hypothetical protein